MRPGEEGAALLRFARAVRELIAAGKALDGNYATVSDASSHEGFGTLQNVPLETLALVGEPQHKTSVDGTSQWEQVVLVVDGIELRLTTDHRPLVEARAS